MIKLEVTEQQMQLIAKALQEQPFKDVAVLIQILQQQINKQTMPETKSASELLAEHRKQEAEAVQATTPKHGRKS